MILNVTCDMIEKSLFRSAKILTLNKELKMSNRLYNIDGDVMVEAYCETINIYSLDNKVEIDVHVLNVEKLISALKELSVEIKSSNPLLQLTAERSIEGRVLKARKLYNDLVFGRSGEDSDMDFDKMREKFEAMVEAENYMPIEDEILLDSLSCL